LVWWLVGAAVQLHFGACARGLRVVLLAQLVLRWLALVSPLPGEENEISLLESAARVAGGVCLGPVEGTASSSAAGRPNRARIEVRGDDGRGGSGGASCCVVGSGMFPVRGVLGVSRRGPPSAEVRGAPMRVQPLARF